MIPTADDWRLATPSRAHAGRRIAPVAIAGGSADRPHLEEIGRSGREAVDAHRPRVGEQAGGLPRPRSVAGAHRRRPHFIALRMRDGRDSQHEFGAVAAADVENRRIRQRGARASVYRGLKTAGHEDSEVVAAVILDVVLQLAQKRDQSRALVVLFRRGGRPALCLGGQGRAQIVDGGLHRLQIDRGRGESGVAGQPL